MRKNVVITGGSGFVGKHLLSFLDCEKFTYTLISRNPDKLNVNRSVFKCVYADLNDLESLKRAFEGQDILINMAAEVRNQDLLEKTNIEGTKSLIQAIITTGIQKVIHLSSVGVVGNGFSLNSTLIDETQLPTPKNKYEETKLISEKLFAEHSNEKFKLVVLRPTNVFGEFHPFHALRTIMNHANDSKRMIYANGAMVNFVYVGDLCQTIVFFLNQTDSEGVFQVGNATPFETFYKMISEKLNRKPLFLRLPTFLFRCAELLGIKKMRPVSNKVVFSDKLLKTEMGAYQFGLDKGLDLTIAYFRKNELVK